MKLQELIFKMQQIEEQAALTLDEYPQGHTVEREAIAKDVESKLRVVESDAEPVRVAVLPQRSTSAEK